MMRMVLLVVIAVLLIGYLAVNGTKKLKTGRANALHNQGKTEEALNIYKKLIASGRASADDRINYANILLRGGDPQAAVEQMNTVLSYSSSALGTERRENAKLTRAIANFKCGECEDALEEAKEVFFEDGHKTMDAYCILTYIMLAMYEPTEEIAELCEDAYDYDEDNRDIIDNLFVCYYRMHDYEQAEELADILVRDYPQFVEAYYHGAVMQIRIGNMEKAKEYAEHLKDCRRTYMTTVSEEECTALAEALKGGEKAANEYLDKLDAQTDEKLKQAALKKEKSAAEQDEPAEDAAYTGENIPAENEGEAEKPVSEAGGEENE